MNVVAEADTSTITVTWDAPTSGATVIGYELDWQNISAGTDWDYVFPSSSDTSAVISNLIPGTYDVMISANALGCARASDCASVSTHIANYVVVGAQQPPTPTPPQVTAPTVPANFGAAADGMGIALHWDAPDPSTSPVVDQYTYFWRLTSNNAWSSNTITAPATGVRVPSLAAGTYRVKVSAQAAGCTYASDCDSGDSAEIEIMISIPPPATDPPLNFQYALDGDNVTLTWETASTAAVGYEVNIYQTFNDGTPDRADYFAPINTPIPLAADQLSYTAVHLRPAGWQFSVRATYPNDQHSSWVSSSVVSVALPDVSVSRPWPRLYSTRRNHFQPTITGVPTTYSVVYRAGSQVLDVQTLASGGHDGVYWTNLSACSINTSVITADVLFLTDTETGVIDGGCLDADANTANIADYTTRLLGSTSVEYMVTAIPVTSAEFVTTTPGETATRTRTQEGLDGEPVMWPHRPTIGEEDPRTGATFLGWTDSNGLLLTNPAAPATAGWTYTSAWSSYLDPKRLIGIRIAGHFADTENALPGAVTYETWVDDEGVLDVVATVRNGVDVTATLVPVNSRGQNLQPNTLEASGASAEFTLAGSSGCETSVDAPTCPRLHRLQIRTTIGPDSNTYDFYLLRAVAPDTVTLTLRDPETSLEYAEEIVEGPGWYNPEGPGDYDMYPSRPNDLFGGWCTSATPTSMDECYTTHDHIPVLGDTTLYPLWISRMLPETMTIGERTFTDADWVLDEANNTIYLTVEANGSNPLSGEISFDGPLGVFYAGDSAYVELETGEQVSSDDGDYNLGPHCPTADPCSTLYWVVGTAEVNSDVMEAFGIGIIATPSLTDTHTVTYDLGNGESLSATSLAAGWHQLPQGQWTRIGYGTDYSWDDDVHPGHEDWWAYFPVLDDTMLSLNWYSGPVVSGQSAVTLLQGETHVGTYSASGNQPTWRSSSADFVVSSSGVVTAAANLAVGQHTFHLFAASQVEGPGFAVTVTVVQPSPPAPSSSVSTGVTVNAPVTQAPQEPVGGPTATVEVTPMPLPVPAPIPMPVSEQPSEPLVALPRELRVDIAATPKAIGVGALTKLTSRSMPAGVGLRYATRTPRMCNVNSVGVVTARAVGTCVIGVTAFSTDPVAKVLPIAPVRVAVKREGTVNTARVSRKSGDLVVEASLIKNFAGRQVSLALLQSFESTPKYVSLRKLTLNHNATGKFAPIAVPRPGSKLVLMAAGRVLCEVVTG